MWAKKTKQKGVSNPSISGTMTGSKRPVDNALNPAWRESVVHLITTQSWDDTLSYASATKAIHDMTFKRGYALRELAPDTGAYFNEVRSHISFMQFTFNALIDFGQANQYEPNWQWSFWGPNYPRLYAIKQKYDPDGLLWCHKCVGSEAWSERKNGTLCRAFQGE